MDRLWKYFSFFLDPVVSKLLMPTVHIEHTDKYMQRCSYPRNTALCRGSDFGRLFISGRRWALQAFKGHAFNSIQIKSNSTFTHF